MANPFIAAEATEEESAAAELPYLTEYAWDFDNNCLKYDANGKPVLVYENEALKVWVYHCLKCERYQYNLYRHGEYNEKCNYGVYLEKYIGSNPNTEKTASLVRKEIREAMLANPYVRQIDYLDIGDIRHENLVIEMGLTSIYGSLKIKLAI